MKSVLNRLLTIATRPEPAFVQAWRRVPVGPFKLRLDYDVFARPAYAYGVYQAARLAHALGIERISIIEFGVAGGRGLLELEDLADQVEREFDTRLEIYGFDTGSGLPDPIDYRDIPYVWQSGFYRMDKDELEGRLRRSTLVLGNASDTISTFVEDYAPAPIGAVFHDFDYYSSTVDALALMHGAWATMLPRVYAYFDDVASVDGAKVMCDRVGQLSAIREFNEVNEMRNLSPIVGLPSSRRVRSKWSEQMYVHHAFDHPDYATYIHPQTDRQLPIG